MKKNRVVFLLGFLGFIVMADNWVVSPILPAISQDIGVAVERAGILIAAYMIPFGIFQIIFGPFMDRYGKKQERQSAIGGKIAMVYGLSTLFGVYGLALLATFAFSFILIAGPVVATHLVPSTKTPQEDRSTGLTVLVLKD